jgi:hypothetical protein
LQHRVYCYYYSLGAWKEGKRSEEKKRKRKGKGKERTREEKKILRCYKSLGIKFLGFSK